MTLSIFVLGGILGLKHSLEPDHLIAVTNIVTETRKVKDASFLGFLWGIGHTLTLMLVGMLLLVLKLQVPEYMASLLEGCVGVMLIYFGIQTWQGKDNHTHSHCSHNRNYDRTLFMGFIHGISGSGSLVLLTMMTVENFIQSAFFILIFGIGTTLSMMVSTTMIGLPFALSYESVSMSKFLTKAASALSIIFGIYYTWVSVIG